MTIRKFIKMTIIKYPRLPDKEDRRRKITISQEKIIVKKRKRGDTYSSLSRLSGLSWNTIRRICLKYLDIPKWEKEQKLKRIRERIYKKNNPDHNKGNPGEVRLRHLKIHRKKYIAYLRAKNKMLSTTQSCR